MPNPGGGNQFGNFTVQPPYGDVKRQTALTREAPISGAPRAAQALDFPDRAQTRGGKPQQAQAPEQQPQAPTPPGPSLAAMWQSIASIPGISPLAHMYAQAASGG